MGKVKSLSEIIKIVAKVKNDGKKVCLITGSFDIIHIGHIKLFHFAKKNTDVTIVGLDNDKNIKLYKGKNRPIHTFVERSEVLTDLISVDWVFEIKEVINYNSPHAHEAFKLLYEKINPDYLVTNPIADRFWKNKQKDAKEIGAKLLLDRRKRMSASTKIINRLLNNEF